MNNRYMYRGKYNNVSGDTGWVEGFLFSSAMDGWCIGVAPLSANDYGELNCWDYVKIDFTTIGQCTGLEDKHGKLIFEGDILQNNEEEFHGVVIWATDCWMIKVYTDNGADYEPLCDWADRTEIVGNIHDSPELLQEAAQ